MKKSKTILLLLGIAVLSISAFGVFLRARNPVSELTSQGRLSLGSGRDSSPIGFEKINGEHSSNLSLATRKIPKSTKELDEFTAIQLEVKALKLNNQGMSFLNAGRYSEAEPLLLEALEIRERVHGGAHQDVARSLNNLASLYWEQGLYGQAEELHLRSLAIRESLPAIDSAEVAESLSNLGVLYYDLGRYERAEDYLKRSLSLREASLGPNHDDVAISLINLAEVYAVRERYEEAEPLFERCIAIFEQNNGPSHPFVAAGLSNLAVTYLDRGQYDRAEPLITRSLAIRERAFEPQDTRIATSLHNLAIVRQGQGKPAEAEAAFRRSLGIYQALLGPEHPRVGRNLYSLGKFFHARAQIPQAIDYYAQSLEIEELNLFRNLLRGTETEKRDYLATVFHSTQAALSLHLQSAPTDSDAANVAFTTLLRRKGRILDVLSQSFTLLRNSLTPSDRALLDELAATRSQLAKLVFNAQSHDAQITELEAKADRLEADLSRRSTEFRREFQPVTSDAVRDALPADAALIEFVQYRAFNAPAPYSDRLGQPRYAVYVLRPDGTLQWHDLGEAATIDAKIEAYRQKLLEVLKPAPGSRKLGDRTQLTPLAIELHNLLIAPIERLANNAEHLLLSPDANLNLLPFGALVDESGQYLIERYRLTYLTSGRDLLRQPYREKPPQAPLALADPDYGTPGILSADIARSLPASRGARDNLPSPNLRSTIFSRLPGTAVEGETLAKIVPELKLLVNVEASENSLKQWQRPKILHIATHGFFFTAPQASGGDRTPIADTDNPLLRSGLALAGFNQRESAGEDGVLTALEASGLDLRGTRLVVLSACGTGLGDVAAGEGVYGLRRAFTLAGAETQIMSLWDVSDEGTQKLMTAYYQRLQAGGGRSEALQQVQLEMLQGQEFADPFFWAPFIPSGDWSQLE